MKVAIDANRYTDLCKGVPHVVAIVEAAAEIHVPLIVLAELRAGFAHGGARAKNERVLTSFLNQPGVFVLAPDEQTTYFYADLYAYLRKRGKPIPTNDLWIAALVVEHNLMLLDRDSDFDALPQLARLSVPG
jgi:predicted nucleic acid-binding protein